jgi:hypothetical protein
LEQEVVVDDVVQSENSGIFDNPSFRLEQQSAVDLPLIAEPLTIPQVFLPEGELVSGKSVRLIVQLPQERPQVAVKLWVEDCQTRCLLDGPRLLTNLLPNSLGKLEVMTYINIPFGCLEIRLEVIAVDLETQQESYKVSINRTVIPPDLPTLQLDELLGI